MSDFLAMCALYTACIIYGLISTLDMDVKWKTGLISISLLALAIGLFVFTFSVIKYSVRLSQ